MYYINAIAPAGAISNDWQYTRFAVIIPREELVINSIKELFPDSPLSEEKLLKAMQEDKRINIISDKEKDRIKNEKAIEIEKAKKIENEEIKNQKRRKNKENLDKEISVFNERKQQAQRTEEIEDDIVIQKEEEELTKKIKEFENG